jgi:Mce-associated membrane protein
VTEDKAGENNAVPEAESTDADEPVSTAVESQTIEEQSSKPVVAPKKSSRTAVAGVRRGARRHWLAIALSAALIASAALTGWMFFSVYKPDRATDAQAVQSAIRAASDGTVALLSYSPDSLDKDFAAAKSKLTGSFLSYYTQFTEQIVAPAAKQKAVKTQAAVVRAAVSEIGPDKAVVLVFINQTTQSKDRPDASFINSSVRVSLQKIDGGWLISSFDPV